MRIITALVSIVAILAAGAPAMQFAVASGVPANCAGHTIRLSEREKGAFERSARLEIRRRHAVVKTVTAWAIGEVDCTDLTGDGRPELIVESFSGGAHCCYTIQVFQLQPALRRILNFEAGNAGGFSVGQGAGGRPALVLGDDGLAYYGDLCFACSPHHIPLVACYDGTRFVECTRQFPAVIQEAVKDAIEQLRQAVQSTHESRPYYMKGAALGVYAAYALLGKEAAGLATVRRIARDPEVTSWLVNQRGGVAEWLRNRAGRLEWKYEVAQEWGGLLDHHAGCGGMVSEIEHAPGQPGPVQVDRILREVYRPLGGLLGRRAICTSTLGRATTAARGASRSYKEEQDVQRAEETVAVLQQQLNELEAQLTAEIDAAVGAVNPLGDALETVAAKPKRTGITVQAVGLAWTPK